MLLDLRTAVRTLRRDAPFAAAVVLTLALGIAPNCVIFAIMDAVYFRPLPYPEQERLALLNTSRPSGAAIGTLDAFTFRALRDRASSFGPMALYRNDPVTLNSGDRPERVAAQSVSGDFFAVLGMAPSRGRTLQPQDGVPGAPRVLVIGHRTWTDYFSSRGDIVGLVVRVDGAPATVVGVMPPAFTSFMEGRTARAWLPMALEASASPADTPAANAIARLHPGTSLGRAEGEVRSIHADLARQFPAFYGERKPIVRDFRGSLFSGLGPGIRLLSVVVGLLLLIACANAANLLLARGAQRTREMAIRTALGGRRIQLARGLLAESLLLAAMGSLAGSLLAWCGIRLIWSRTAPLFQAIGVEGFAFDHRLLAFAAALTAIAAMLFGVLPALRASRADITTDLGGGSREVAGRTRGARTSRVLVVGQAALCVVTMVAATLVLRSVVHFSRVAANPGFRAETLLVATLPHVGDGSSIPAPRRDVVGEAERRVAALPGVRRVALTDRLPFLEGGVPAAVFKEGTDAGSGRPGQRLDADIRAVDADFFAVTSMPLLRGRIFTSDDAEADRPVVVISERLATASWKGDPIGERLQVNGTWRTIVGVVRSSVQPSPFRPSSREAFVPFARQSGRDVKVIVQSSGEVAALASAVRGAVRAVDPDQPVARLQTMNEALDAFMTPFLLILTLTMTFGVIALALAGVGLYGVIARGIARRRREIGIRMALGAGRGEIVRMVVRSGLRLAGAGLAVGLLLGLAVAKILPSEILGVTPLSAWHYGAALSVWLAVAVAACLVPARRAARLEPVSALRCD